MRPSQVKLLTAGLINIMAKPKETKMQKEESTAAQAVGGKFARSMNEYKKHLILVYSQE